MTDIPGWVLIAYAIGILPSAVICARLDARRHTFGLTAIDGLLYVVQGFLWPLLLLGAAVLYAARAVGKGAVVLSMQTGTVTWTEDGQENKQKPARTVIALIDRTGARWDKVEDDLWNNGFDEGTEMWIDARYGIIGEVIKETR